MTEYSEWIVAYNKYLIHMYENIFHPYLNRKEKKVMTFDKFCEFVYSHSSKDIVEYL